MKTTLHLRAGAVAKAAAVFSFLLAVALASSAHAAINLTMTYSGEFSHMPFSDPDTLGLDGASFVWTGEFDANATRTYTNGVNLDGFDATTPLSLVITGSDSADGTYGASLQRVAELSADSFLPGFVEFDLGANNNLDLGSINLPAGFMGAISPTNTITPFNTSDVTGFGSIFLTNFNNRTDSVYEVNNGSFTSVPEPSSSLLIGLTSLAFALRRRR